MKRFFQAATLFGALFLGQQAFAQDSIQERRQKDTFYIPQFHRENATPYVLYQDPIKQILGLNYSPRLNLNSPDGNELDNLLRHAPLLRTFYPMAADKEPIQLGKGFTFTFYSSRRNPFPGSFSSNQFPGISPSGPVIRKGTSLGNGLFRGFMSAIRGNNKKPI